MTITITPTTTPYPLLHRRLYPHTLMLLVKQVIWQIVSFLDVAMSGVQTLQGEDLKNILRVPHIKTSRKWLTVAIF